MQNVSPANSPASLAPREHGRAEVISRDGTPSPGRESATDSWLSAALTGQYLARLRRGGKLFRGTGPAAGMDAEPELHRSREHRRVAGREDKPDNALG